MYYYNWDNDNSGVFIFKFCNKSTNFVHFIPSPIYALHRSRKICAWLDEQHRTFHPSLNKSVNILRYKCLMVRCLTPWISLEDFNKKEIQVNLCKIFSFLIFNELYLFTNDSQSPKTRARVMKYLGSVVSLVFLPKTSIWNKITFRLLNFFDIVWHDGVIYKIKCIGIIGMFLRFILSFLESKLQSVVLSVVFPHGKRC